MMAGLLLARAGVDVVVIEKHADFLRDFRGDTIHPSTLEVIQELGCSTACCGCGFIALMPQWDFLDVLAREAGRCPTFRLLMRPEATGLVEESGRIAGVRATTPEEPITIHADLVVGTHARAVL